MIVQSLGEDAVTMGQAAGVSNAVKLASQLATGDQPQ